MGNWAIVIHGVGVHHNEKLPEDANRMAARFVDELKKAGHNVTGATFTYGGEEDVSGGAVYEAKYLPEYVTVEVNGNALRLKRELLSYEEISLMCGYDPEHNPTVVYSSKKGPSGILVHGGKVELTEGLHIDCVITGNA